MISADGLCGINRDQRITLWNEAATRLLGYTSNQVRGRFCFEILAGLDENGCRICKHDCPGFVGANRLEPHPGRDILVRAKSGKPVWLSLSTLIPTRKRDDNIALIHVFRDVTRQKCLQLGVQGLVDNAQAQSVANGSLPPLEVPLTSREHEILSLLASGESTMQIAQTLTVSSGTVRRHVENILHKLHAHSRLEAVSLAHRYKLLV